MSGMNRMANYDRIVFERFEDGFYVVHDEGWTEREWMRARHVCGICDAAFVTLTADGTAIAGSKQRYCSRQCGQSAAGRTNRRTDRPPYEQLLEEISRSSYSAVGLKYGVSDRAIRKWIRAYEREAADEHGEAA